MRIKRKKVILICLFLLVILVAAGISYRYLPLNRILRVSSSAEMVIENQPQYASSVPNTLSVNFESVPGVPPVKGIYTGIAHSGKNSTKAFGTNSFSTVVERTAGEIGVTHLDMISMSAWVYVFPGNNEVNASLVFSASNNGVNVVWKGVNLKGKDVPRGKWFKISGNFELGDVKFKPGYQVQVYFWNNSNNDILADDFYVVFGAPRQRRGDSVLVDINRGTGFPARFNFPPFPFHFFVKDEIHNDNSSFLVQNVNPKEGDINPGDPVLTGHFSGNTGGTEDLLVIRKTGGMDVYTWCREKEVFHKLTIQITTALTQLARQGTVFAGSFTEPGSRQLMLSDKQGSAIVGFEKKGDPCSGNTAALASKTIWNAAVNPFLIKGGSKITVADLDGDKLSEVLVCNEDGSWSVYKFETGKPDPWKMIASGDGKTGGEWDSKQFDFSVQAGRFLKNSSEDLLLTVFHKKGSRTNGYSLLRFDASTKKFTSFLKGKEGKTAGLDTLKPGDLFLCGKFDPAGNTTLLRYSRDWRYDLKEIRFNDTTFQIMANMDFEGFAGDHNPKYFEVLKLCSGEFIRPGINSLLVIGKNRSHKGQGAAAGTEFVNLPVLPNVISVYSLKSKEN
jgi:hypothetical protein